MSDDESPQYEPDPQAVDWDKLKRLRGIGAREPESAPPPGTTVWNCPLPECGWTLVQPSPGPASPGPVITGEGLDEAASRATMAVMREWYAWAEEALEAHLSAHTTLEWVTEISRLNGIMGTVALELADDGRIGRSLLTGAMATRANLAREECLDLLGRQ